MRSVLVFGWSFERGRAGHAPGHLALEVTRWGRDRTPGHAIVTITDGDGSRTLLDEPVRVEMLRRGAWCHLLIARVRHGTDAAPLLTASIHGDAVLYVRSGVPALAGLRGGTYDRVELHDRGWLPGSLDVAG